MLSLCGIKMSRQVLLYDTSEIKRIRSLLEAGFGFVTSRESQESVGQSAYSSIESCSHVHIRDEAPSPCTKYKGSIWPGMQGNGLRLGFIWDSRPKSGKKAHVELALN